MRIGNGFDVHAYAADRPLWLGCIEWPDERGLAGHSDADVVAHAVCDALLSAAGAGDLGSNFGIDKPEYANAAGVVFLKASLEIVTSKGFAIENISVQVIANTPNISSRRTEMEQAVSKSLDGADVSISGTTTDGLGFTGRGEGVAAIATCLLRTV
jgi:2-C-methyl-D-erythritol 2,4-cyclodiphosphate synthase